MLHGGVSAHRACQPHVPWLVDRRCRHGSRLLRCGVARSDDHEAMNKAKVEAMDQVGSKTGCVFENSMKLEGDFGS